MGAERAVRRWRQMAPVVGLCAAMATPAARAASQNTGALAPATVISGVVRDTSGQPLTGAQVSAGGAFAATTSQSGAFRLMGVPRGPITLTVRHLGFRMITTHWDADGDSLSLDLRLNHLPATLPAYRVVARAQPYDARLAGFNSRRERRLGYYITRADLEQRSDHVVADALREVPGIRLHTSRDGGSVAYVAGARCAALIFVDGFPATLGNFDLNGIDLDAVEGIEVYPNAASMPSEFLAPGGGEQCGVVAIWLAPMRPRARSDAVRQQQKDVDVAALISSHQVYRPDSVDEQASLVSGTTTVAYPDSLLRAGIGGQLFASFVVDTAGAVEIATLSVKAAFAPAAAFVSAIRAALGRSEFTPARLAGRAVRQLVVLPFLFDPNAVDSARSSLPERGAGAIPWGHL